MKYIIIICLASFMFSYTANCQENEFSPKIVSTIPEYGDCNVGIDTKEIILKFDQDMQGGLSAVDTKDMPEITGKPNWIDKRTLAIPVKLIANKVYHMVFNNQKFNNFRNEQGIPLQPTQLVFKTQSLNYVELNKEAYKELFTYLPAYYSYAEIKNIDFETEIRNREKEFSKCISDVDFAINLLAVLQKANDMHMSVEIKGQKYYSGAKRITQPNYVRSNSIFKTLDNKVIGNSFQFAGGKFENAGYVSIKNWNFDIENLDLKCLGIKDSTINVIGFLRSMDTLPNIIIDVRENSGGNEMFAKQFASCFANDTLAYEKIIVRDTVSNKFEKERMKYLYPNKEQLNYKGNVYVLIGPDVMSSNESFALMMQQLPNAKLVGMKTYGSTGNPHTIELANHVKINIPSWQAYTLQGNLIEGNGIQPDIEFISRENNQMTKESYRKKQEDQLLNKVIEITNSNN